MKKIYTLKPWDAVENHHFISKGTWDEMVEVGELEVAEFKLFMCDDVLIAPKGTEARIGTAFCVKRDDLKVTEVEDEPVTKKPKKEKSADEKTYTKADLRKKASEIISDFGKEEKLDLSSITLSAIALSRLINELN